MSWSVGVVKWPSVAEGLILSLVPGSGGGGAIDGAWVDIDNDPDWDYTPADLPFFAAGTTGSAAVDVTLDDTDTGDGLVGDVTLAWCSTPDLGDLIDSQVLTQVSGPVGSIGVKRFTGSASVAGHLILLVSGGPSSFEKVDGTVTVNV